MTENEAKTNMNYINKIPNFIDERIDKKIFTIDEDNRRYEKDPKQSNLNCIIN